MYNTAIERFKNEKIGVVIQCEDEYIRFATYLKDYGWEHIPGYSAQYNCYVCNWMDKREFSLYPEIINGSTNAVLNVSHNTWKLINFEELFRPDIKVDEDEFLNILLTK